MRSCQNVSTDTILALDAEAAGLAPSTNAGHDMLHLDDELAGLVEAADMAAAQAGAHPTKPEPASPVPGEVSVVLCNISAVPRKVQLHLMSTQRCLTQSTMQNQAAADI